MKGGVGGGEFRNEFAAEICSRHFGNKGLGLRREIGASRARSWRRTIMDPELMGMYDPLL